MVISPRSCVSGSPTIGCSNSSSSITDSITTCSSSSSSPMVASSNLGLYCKLTVLHVPVFCIPGQLCTHNLLPGRCPISDHLFFLCSSVVPLPKWGRFWSSKWSSVRTPLTPSVLSHSSPESITEAVCITLGAPWYTFHDFRGRWLRRF